MIKPRALKFGDTLGVIAPSGPAIPENIEKAKKNLEMMGFKVKLGSSCCHKYGYLAGSDEERAEDLNQMFLNKEVSGIFCLRGGYGSTRILDKIDYTAVRDNHKIFVGYSDITALHIALNTNCKLITFHGPMVASDMVEGLEDFSKKCLLEMIMKEERNNRKIENPAGDTLQCLIEGKAEGILIGGNLSVIIAGLGTPYEIQTKGKILFLEDIGEEPYKIDRMLTQLKSAGKLKDIAGIILGDWNKCETSNEDQSMALFEVLKDRLCFIKKPILYNLRAGHCTPKVTLPLGAKIYIDGAKKEILLKEIPVC